MCAGIEYVRDGERVSVYFDSDNPDLPVRMRSGTVRFYCCGRRSAQYFSPDNLAVTQRSFLKHAARRWLTSERAMDSLRAAADPHHRVAHHPGRPHDRAGLLRAQSRRVHTGVAGLHRQS